MNLIEKRLLEGIAEILELQGVTADHVLDESSGWDSMAVVMVVALIDDVTGKAVDGPSVAACKTVGDILKVAE